MPKGMGYGKKGGMKSGNKKTGMKSGGNKSKK